ncbi:hypothetical protein [Neisseria sp. Ec49-e6-T10]|uniref:hypothetical protein n=1 Tax=Neisseria sp. Ec49-e6-T10 TaxID=3140744 RepID=UPI003EBB9499
MFCVYGWCIKRDAEQIYKNRNSEFVQHVSYDEAVQAAKERFEKCSSYQISPWYDTLEAANTFIELATKEKGISVECVMTKIFTDEITEKGNRKASVYAYR